MKKYKCKSAVYTLLALIVVIAFVGYKSRVVEVREAEARVLNNMADSLQKENMILSIQVKESKSVRLSKGQIEKLLEVLMPKKDDRNRFMAILACENGTYDPKRVNVNKPGLGYDLGIAQINSRFHSDKVKEFFGEDFNAAMSDPVKSLVYAVYLYQNSGNFSLWVCDRIVASK